MHSQNITVEAEAAGLFKSDDEGWSSETAWFEITANEDGDVVAIHVAEHDHNDHAPEPYMYDEALAMMDEEGTLVVRWLNGGSEVHTYDQVVELRNTSFAEYGLTPSES